MTGNMHRNNEDHVARIKRKKRYAVISILIIVLMVGVKHFWPDQDYTRKEKNEELKQYTHLKIDSTSDYLFAISTDSLVELGSPIGYRNTKGDTVITIGKYSHCWTDTLKTFAIVFDTFQTNGVAVAIDKKEHVLFDIYFFDNWPDELIEGLFRIKRNNKIGYANELGEIIIACEYACAYPFKNGKAKVAYECEESVDNCGHITPQSKECFYIDKNGIEILVPQD